MSIHSPSKETKSIGRLFSPSNEPRVTYWPAKSNALEVTFPLLILPMGEEVITSQSEPLKYPKVIPVTFAFKTFPPVPY